MTFIPTELEGADERNVEMVLTCTRKKKAEESQSRFMEDVLDKYEEYGLPEDIHLRVKLSRRIEETVNGLTNKAVYSPNMFVDEDKMVDIAKQVYEKMLVDSEFKDILPSKNQVCTLAYNYMLAINAEY